MRSVRIAELKNQLSKYIGMVREGEEILVRERDLPVAKIVPLSGVEDLDAEELALAAAGLLRLPEAPLPDSFFRNPAPKLSARRAAKAVSDNRDED
jgi:prevent-host-death family protein